MPKKYTSIGLYTSISELDLLILVDLLFSRLNRTFVQNNPVGQVGSYTIFIRQCGLLLNITFTMLSKPELCCKAKFLYVNILKMC